MRAWRLSILLALWGCETTEDPTLKACLDPAPECAAGCPDYAERLVGVQAEQVRRSIDDYIAYTCGDGRVIKRFSDAGEDDSYYDARGRLVAIAQHGGRSSAIGEQCLGAVQWQGDAITCNPGCALASSDNPVVLFGLRACGLDMGVGDAGRPDGGPGDGGRPDAAGPDGGRPDGGRPDVGRPDLGRPDAAVDPDATAPDAAVCAAEGASVPVVPNALACCPGLSPIGCDRPDGQGMCPGGCDGATICARCGDGICGPGENLCNCAVDCDHAGCVPAGGAVPVVPNAPSCCPGLSPIGCDAPNGQGLCPGGCVGASICAQCGDGVCGAGENLCNCPRDCPAAGQCSTTTDCVDHPAPIRCLGGWRCDPAGARPADHRGDDGCTYTCLGSLQRCDANAACPDGDRCAPCPVDGQCAGAEVCRPQDDLSCRRVEDCAGLPHDACVGDAGCVADRCTWTCR